MTIIDIKNMAYTANGSINSIVEFEEIGEVPFTISYTDTEAHGRAWTRARSGEFGDIAPYVEPEPLPPQVPTQITPRQLRLKLLSLGLLDDVEAMCNADKAMSIWFEYSLDFQRNHEMIDAMASQLGMTDEQVDEFFIEASKL